MQCSAVPLLLILSTAERVISLWFVLWHAQYISFNTFYGRISDISLGGKYLAERDHSLINVISLHLLRGTEENYE